jgi:Ca2+-binding RTX toxin-like protein
MVAVVVVGVALPGLAAFGRNGHAASRRVVELRGTAGDDRLILSVRGGRIVAAAPGHPARAIRFDDGFLRSRSRVELRIAGGAGSDLVTVDLAGGMPIPAGGLVDDGGAGPGSDALAIQGGSVRSETDDATGPGSGRILLDRHRIDYRGLEPITDTTPVTNYTFTDFTTGGPINLVDSATKGQDEINDGGTSRFELVDFANKQNVVINGSANPDTISMHVTAPAAALSTVKLDGEGDQDTMAVAATPSSVSTTVTDSGGTVDTVGLGGGGSVAGLLGPISVSNPLGLTKLTVDASIDGPPRACTLTKVSVQGLAPVPIDYVPGDLTSLRILGGRGADDWVVDSTGPFPNVLATGGGADRVTVEGAVEASLAIQGGAGNDILAATTSAPTGASIAFVGGPGNDRFHLAGGVSLGDEVKGGPGTDTVSYAGSHAPVSVDLARGPGTGTGTLGLASVENATGGNGNDHIAGSSVANVLTGGAGSDVLTGRTGSDKLLGGRGNDTLNAHDGVHGNDTANGGPGTDTCSTDPGDHRIACEH